MHESQAPGKSRASVFDVAEYILEKMGPMSAMKLQKLVYYCQAWSLVWDDRPLFPERIEAWREGPVVPALFERHRGAYLVQAGDVGGRPRAMDEAAKDTVDTVLDAYGGMSGDELSRRTHAEGLWRETWGRRASEARGVDVITAQVMRAFYASLLPSPLGGSRRFYLRALLQRVRPENRHEAVSTGRPVGREVW